MCVYKIDEIRQMVAPIAKEYSIDKVFIFGSYARGEATEKSDIDLYIENTCTMGLSFCGLWVKLEDVFKKRIDLISQDGLYNPTTLEANQCLIDNILKERLCVYGRIPTNEIV